MDTLGMLLALLVSPASEGDRAPVEELSKLVQQATGATVETAYVDQGYSGEPTEPAAAKLRIKLEVVTLEGPKRGLVLPRRRWVVECNVAWAAWFRRLARDYERLSDTLAWLHFVAFAKLMLARLAKLAILSQ